MRLSKGKLLDSLLFLLIYIACVCVLLLGLGVVIHVKNVSNVPPSNTTLELTSRDNPLSGNDQVARVGRKRPNDSAQKSDTNSMSKTSPLSSFLSSWRKHTALKEPTKTPTTTPTQKTEATPVKPTTRNVTPAILLGVHEDTKAGLNAFEEYLGQKVTYVAIDIHWGNENGLPAFAEDIKKNGSTLFIFWNPMDYERSLTNQKQFHYDAILSGKWDTYIDELKTSIRSYGAPVVLAPFEEINGNWIPWSGSKMWYGSVDDYKLTFAYLRDKFRDVPNVKFAWVINHVSVPDTPQNSIRTYYPGDENVDIVGINAFNFGDPWLSFDALVERSIKELQSLNKPLLITSTASAEGPQKNEWIEAFRNSTYFHDGTLTGWIWFNENKERNWLIWSNKND